MTMLVLMSILSIATASPDVSSGPFRHLQSNAKSGGMSIVWIIILILVSTILLGVGTYSFLVYLDQVKEQKKIKEAFDRSSEGMKREPETTSTNLSPKIGGSEISGVDIKADAQSPKQLLLARIRAKVSKLRLEQRQRFQCHLTSLPEEEDDEEETPTKGSGFHAEVWQPTSAPEHPAPAYLSPALPAPVSAQEHTTLSPVNYAGSPTDSSQVTYTRSSSLKTSAILRGSPDKSHARTNHHDLPIQTRPEEGDSLNSPDPSSIDSPSVLYRSTDLSEAESEVVLYSITDRSQVFGEEEEDEYKMSIDIPQPTDSLVFANLSVVGRDQSFRWQSEVQVASQPGSPSAYSGGSEAEATDPKIPSGRWV